MENEKILTINGKSYRLQRVIDKTATNIHHIISRKERNRLNTNHERNKMKINMRLHDALNRFYGDKQNPKKQLEFMFNIWKEVLSPGVRQELYTLFTLPDDMFYHEDLLKNGRNKKKRTKGWE